MIKRVTKFICDKKILLITYVILAIVAWVLGQMAVPAIMKAIFVGGQI